MSWYTYWQAREGEAAWELALAEDRAKIIRDNQPPLMTVLDLDTVVEGTMTGEELAAVKYRGPLYFDFDSDSIEEVIPKFHQFLDKLEETGVKLSQVGLFASGGKGFHVIIPVQVFIEKPSPQGYAFLPNIYREIADKLYVNTLDMRVYSARKGRMFRVENVKRKNDRYKVPLTVAEARAITPESYIELTSAPRPAVPLDAPAYCSGLALLFVTSRDFITKSMERRKKNKGDAKLIAKFKGDFPPSLAGVLAGTAVNSEIGFQKLALQLAIVSHKLSKTEDQLIEAAAGLIANHVSDGNRYNTPAKRTQELRRMYQYMHENPCYDVTIGGLKSMMPPGTSTPDLDDGFEAEAVVDADGVEQVPAEEEFDFGITLGMRVSRAGIFVKREEGMVRLSAAGWANPRELIAIDSDTSYAFQVDAYRDGKPMGVRRLDKACFASRARMLNFTHELGCNLNATDAQVGGLLDVTRAAALRHGKPIHAVQREGIDVLTLPGAKTREDCAVVYVSKDGVLHNNDDRLAGMDFMLHGKRDPKGEIKSDIHLTDPLQGNEEERVYLEKLFKLNKTATIAKVLGYMLAAWISQPIRRGSNQFPMLQVFGIRGSGKSTLTELMNRLHYNQAEMRRVLCMSTTPFFTEGSVSSSASIPVLFDEYKPTEMDKRKLDHLNGIFRGNWDCAMIGKGFVDKTTNTLTTETYPNGAPIVFLSETFISQPAIVDRSVLVPMRPADRADVDETLVFDCVRHAHLMSRWGRSCLDAAIGIKMEKLLDWLRDAKAEVSAEVRRLMKLAGVDTPPDRPIHAQAVILTGLEFGRLVLAEKFGAHFDAQFADFKASIMDDLSSIIQSSRSEPAQLFDALAWMSGADDPEWKLRLGLDYEPYEDKGGRLCIDIQVTEAHNRYMLYCKKYGHSPLFEKFEAFKSALHNHESCVAKKPQSKLRRRIHDEIARFDLEKLYKERITEFAALEADEKTTVG